MEQARASCPEPWQRAIVDAFQGAPPLLDTLVRELQTMDREGRLWLSMLDPAGGVHTVPWTACERLRELGWAHLRRDS